MEIEELIKDKNTTIVDVRTVEEFELGNVEGSLNIPMHEVNERMDELKSLAKPLVLICLSGNRSGQVMQYLHTQGMEDVYNGGGWQEVLQIKNS